MIACLILMILISVVILGLTDLAAIELRRAARADQTAQAKANARLALVLAIGQLQKTLGPDQRVSANADILGGNPKQALWTGAWRTTQDDGSSFYQRDDLHGGLADTRWPKQDPPAARVLEWLVSGTADPFAKEIPDPVTLAHGDGDAEVEAPKIELFRRDGTMAGHHAWWTGDLGVRANVGTRDPRNDKPVNHNSPDKTAWFRLLASQAADPSMMQDGVTLKDSETRCLASTGTVALTAEGKTWNRNHALDLTVDSLGVLADVSKGGLKRDLTAFFAANGDIPAWKNLPGLAASDPLVGDPADSNNGKSRHSVAAPRFGLLADWARLAAPFSGKNVASRLPDLDPAAGSSSATFSLANEQPVKLAGNRHAGLQPILVEATKFTQLSAYKSPGTTDHYRLRFHHYPRVVLWNPYNVQLNFDRSMIMIQGNGRFEMWTDDATLDANGNVVPYTNYPVAQWLSFEGGRNTSFSYDPSDPNGLFGTAGYNDPYIGAYYFSIPQTRFEPGECLVFSPSHSAEYDCLSTYRPEPYNLNSNELSCTAAPDPARSYYISGSDLGSGIDFFPIDYWFAPTPGWNHNGRIGVENQSDDTRAVLKSVGTGTVHFEDFDASPQVAVVSCSLQYGAGREPRIAWNSAEKMPVEMLDAANPQPKVVPNVRTRETVRLRWFDEHPSNLLNSGPLTNTAYFQEALLGNWNPRASYAVRSPWENIGGSLPVSGTAGGPWFFGAYTRDLYDQSVEWGDQMPMISGGRCHGNPFGPPQEGAARYILFDVPRAETGVISLAQFQHVKLSELVWHPSYAIGNSLVDPRLGSGGFKGLSHTAPTATDNASAGVGGFHQDQLGWSADTERSTSPDAWATAARALLGGTPDSDNLVYDLSFEVNQTLWDHYFLSTGSAADKALLLKDPANNPLPNSRMCLAPQSNPKTTADKLTDFQQAASALMVDGAFNVNSTRVGAWEALLGSTHLTGYAQGENVPFPRVLDAPDGSWKNGDPTDRGAAWAGHRELTKDEIRQFAEAIVSEVKLRGPFLSLADFVNRRLAEDETGRMGALQAAIDKAGLNSGMTSAYPLNNQSSLPNYTHPDHIPDPTLLEQTLKPACKAWGAPNWLTQADVLQVIGPVLSARSDTFVIRAYGDAVDPTGTVTARAWCEAVIQRTPEPLDPDDSGVNPRLAGNDGMPAQPGGQSKAGDFGRRFLMVSFRWLTPTEI